MNKKNNIRIELPHLKVGAIVYGDESDIPVLALHGWLDNAATFDYLAPMLKGIKLISLDLIGHGLSDWRPMGSHYHIIDFVTDLFDVADHLGLERFSVVGHSLGAAIASLAAGLLPDRISKVLLIDGLGPFTTKPNEISLQYQRAFYKHAKLSDKKLPVYSNFEMALNARAESGQLSLKSAKPIVERGLIQTEKGFEWRTDPRLTNPSFLQMTEEQALGILKNIEAPTGIIMAEKGLIPHFPGKEERFNAIKNLHLHSINAGHHLHLDCPEKLSAFMINFLKVSQ